MPTDRYAPRKQARQSRARETIEGILQASAQIVARHGLEGLTTNHIAERAGVSIGSLYQYFPGKDAVFHSLIEREFNRSVDVLVGEIEGISAATCSLEEAIARVVRRVFEVNRSKAPFLRQLLLAAVSIRHLQFTLGNDARVLAALRAKLREYGDAVDHDALPAATFLALYALKGVQIGVLFGHEPHDGARLEALLVRTLHALVAGAR